MNYIIMFADQESNIQIFSNPTDYFAIVAVGCVVFFVHEEVSHVHFEQLELGVLVTLFWTYSYPSCRPSWLDEHRTIQAIEML